MYTVLGLMIAYQPTVQQQCCISFQENCSFFKATLAVEVNLFRFRCFRNVIYKNEDWKEKQRQVLTTRGATSD